MRAKRGLTTLLGLLALAGALAPAAQASPEQFGLSSVSASLSSAQAGAHPDVTMTIAVKEDPESEPNAFGLKDAYAPTKDMGIELPPGLVGDPNVLGLPQQCAELELVTWATGGGCPNASQVGVAKIYAYGLSTYFTEPIYMMVPPGGDTVARLGLIAGIFPTFVDLKVRTAGDYGLTAEIQNASSEATLVKVQTTIWGVPAAPAHDSERMTPEESFNGASGSPPRPPGGRVLPFMINASACGPPAEVRVSADNWYLPGRFSSATTTLPAISGCNKLGFAPSLSLEPTAHRTEAPTGLDVSASFSEAEGAGVLANSDMRDARLRLPAGLTVAPGAADGLQACSSAQLHLGEDVAAQCPDASKLASAEFDIPALERTLQGAVYLRSPEPGHLFRTWLVSDDLGVHVKLPAELEIDEGTGQITALVLDAPQVPLREASFHFKSGSRASLATPRRCGTYEAEWEFSPWSGNPAKSGSSPFSITEGCGAGGFAPGLSAGTTSPAAGAYSPFVFDLTREDGEQNPASLDVTLPAGMSAKLAGVERCEGVAASTGDCPAASRIGKVIAAVGPGPTPLWAPQPGKDPTAVYLGGPYEGGPLSIVAVVPAQAGPFDLGTVVVRSAIHVDPLTAKVTVASDPLPQILQGIPLSYRDIHIVLDRPDFTFNPTSCEVGEVSSTVASAEGAVAHPSSRFQAAGCRGLGFKPRLGLKLRGGTRRGAFPALHLVYRPRKGDANMSRLALRFPHSEFIEQGHFRTICTRVQFAAGDGFGSACPKGSVYGHVKIWTPILDEPLRGPVYLRSSNHNLPDVVLALHGPPSVPGLEVEVPTRIDSVHGGLRAIASGAPDVPVSAAVVNMQGGQKGLFVNSTNLCAGKHRAHVAYTAHNGKRAVAKPLLRAVKCAKHKRKKHERHRWAG